MGWFGNKKNKLDISFFELAHDYGMFTNQKKTGIVSAMHDVDLKGVLSDFDMIIKEQRKRLGRIKEISSGRLSFIKETKEILPTLKTHEIESTDYSHFADVIIPAINFALQNELVRATDYYRNQICPLLYREYRKVSEEARKYTELSEEENKDETIINIEQQILIDLEKHLDLQEGCIRSIRANPKNTSGELTRLAKLINEEGRLATILFTDEQVIRGLLLALKKVNGDLKKSNLKRKSRIKALIRLIFRGVAPVGLAVWLTLWIIKPPKYTNQEIEEKFSQYVGRTPSQVISQLKVEDLPQDIRGQLIEEVKGKVAELPAGGMGEAHDASFERTSESLMSAYHEALLRIFKEKYEEKIAELKAKHPEMVVPEMDWEEASTRLKALIWYDKPTILKEMKKIRENESLFDYLKRTGGRPTWTNQAEKNVEKWAFSKVQQIFTEFKRSISDKIEKKLTPEFILQIEEHRKSGKPIPWYLEIIGDAIMFMRDNLLVLLAALFLSFMPPKKLNPFNILRRTTIGYYRKGFPQDLSVLVHGYLLEAIRSEIKR